MNKPTRVYAVQRVSDGKWLDLNYESEKMRWKTEAAFVPFMDSRRWAEAEILDWEIDGRVVAFDLVPVEAE